MKTLTILAIIGGSGMVMMLIVAVIVGIVIVCSGNEYPGLEDTEL